jgi:hypothetical protein
MSEKEQVEVVPGCWMSKQYLATEAGQRFAEHIRKDYERQQAMIYERVPPEVWRFEVDIHNVGPARIELDAQKLISEVTRMTAPLTGYPSKWTADKEREHAVPIVKAVRRILQSRIRRDLRAAFNILKADAMFDALLALDGGIFNLKDRREVEQIWRDQRLKYTSRKYKAAPGPESSFPTPESLKAALREALKTLSEEKPGKKITVPDVLAFFQGHPKYPSCEGEATFRHWLRKHKLPKWRELRDSILVEIQK